MTAQASVRTNTYSSFPLVNLYAETAGFWKKNYESFIENAKDLQHTYGANGFGEGKEQTAYPSRSAVSAYEATLSAWQKSIQELFGHFYKGQIEAYRFLSDGWERYLKLHDQLSHSRTISELGSVQAAFFRQLADDFIKETEKLTHPSIRVKPDGAGTSNA